MITIKIDGYPCIPLTDELASSLATLGEDVAELNYLKWPVGASNPAKGVFLVHSSVASKLAETSVSGAVTVELRDDSLPEESGVVSAAMYQIEHRPVHISKVSSPSDGLYAVTLVDARYFWAGVNTDTSFDVTTTNDRTAFYDETKNSGSAWTWAEIIDYLGALVGTVIGRTAVTGTVGDPTDYLLTYDPVTTTLDRVCAALGMIFVAEVGGGYSIEKPDSLNANAIQHNTTFLRERMAGGYFLDSTTAEGILWLNAIMPSAVIVRFPRQIPAGSDTAGATGPPPLRQVYFASSTSGMPTGATGRSGYTITLDDAMWAVGPIGSETNATALQARADYLAAAYYNRWKTTLHDARLMGFVNLGNIAGTVTWRLTAGGAFTDIHVLDGLTDADKSGKDMVIGLGGIQTHRTRDGALVVSGAGGWGNVAMLNIVGTVTMGGVYTIKLVTPSGTTMNHTGSTFTATTLGTAAAATSGYFYNIMEMGQTTHDLVSTTSTATVALGLFIGNNTDGTSNWVGPLAFPGCS